jgi:hypothetical protein
MKRFLSGFVIVALSLIGYPAYAKGVPPLIRS